MTHVDSEKWSRIPSATDVVQTVAAMEARGMNVIQAQNGQKALEPLKEIIPPWAEVMNGSSTTLIEIGYEQFMKSNEHRWKNLHDGIVAENDANKRHELRRKSVIADYFISGANAIATSGEIVACDKTGSRVGAWAFAAGHLILVCGINKIVPTLDEALRRIREYVYPLEDARVKRASGDRSQIGKCVILANEEVKGRVTLILINEQLGY